MLMCVGVRVVATDCDTSPPPPPSVAVRVSQSQEITAVSITQPRDVIKLIQTPQCFVSLTHTVRYFFICGEIFGTFRE